MINRYSFEGLRGCVLGLGVSGLAAAQVLKRIGGRPTVYDQKPSDSMDVVQLTDELRKDDIEVISGWHGRIDPADYDFMVVSPGFRRDHPAIRDFAEKPVMSEVEFSFRVAQAPILAVTGTNGKSTTTVLLWTIMNSCGVNAHLCGNIAGSGHPEQPLSMAAYSAKPDEYLVAEVSSYQLEFVKLFRPKVSTILNVTPDHMDRHPSFDDYVQTKLRILANAGKGDAVVVNSDEPSVSGMWTRSPMSNGAFIVTFSPGGSSVSQNNKTRRTQNGIFLGDHFLPLDKLKVKGEHFVSNLMTAWEMASILHAPGEPAIQAVVEFKGLEHRLEIVGTKGGVTVINNSMCTNPAALIQSSQAISGRQHLIVGGNTKRLDFSEVGRFVRTHDHCLYLIGSSGTSLNSMLGGSWPEYNSLEEAFETAAAEASAGESIVLSPGCASAEPYRNFKQRGEAFREIAKEWLER